MANKLTLADIIKTDFKAISLETGISKIEYVVYSDNKTIRVFRSDCEDMDPIVKIEAFNLRNKLTSLDPKGNYYVKKIDPKHKKIRYGFGMV